MLSFLARRVVLGVLVMWCVTVVVFLIFYVGPGAGDVARTLAGREASPATVALIAHNLLLDRPWYVQYGHFLFQLVHGNLGYDYYNQEAVSTIVGQAFPVTLSLIVGAAPLWLAMGVLSRPARVLFGVVAGFNAAVAVFWFAVEGPRTVSVWPVWPVQTSR